MGKALEEEAEERPAIINPAGPNRELTAELIDALSTSIKPHSD